ncbi:Haloacid dehalogenase type II [Penicillium argentinense]|uniref:Haloacid dehalogenase type II n=1 Tax=Penicillium argentinense TaxID=1131581 RepID=A0A9W9KEN3_9EURO|nr:Haloacid dehalogenase type II [Penicillium argentinense]KAJ5102913.1 Haloacid dehalogenase type II [Penicillium argentinense]
MPEPPRALFFDTFGTVVKWRPCVSKDLRAAAQQALADSDRDLPADVRDRATSLTDQDWLDLAVAWRRSYGVFTRNFDPSEKFISVDQHHYAALQELLDQRGIRPLFNDGELWDLTFAWHRLDPWADSAQGVALLNTKFITSTLSNGNVSLLEDLKKHGSLPFTHLTSSEHFRAYKPSPQVYYGAAKRLGLEPCQCALVSAHLDDLQAAKSCGFQAIYVARELEEQWSAEKVAQTKADGWVNIWVDQGAGGFIEVARQFGIQSS